MFYSFVIPVYNRPQEIEELLESLSKQTLRSFEVIVVEDGSREDAQAVIDKYVSRLPIKYIFQDNTGPGGARNTGSRAAKGDYIIYLDSDCVVPVDYLSIVDRFLAVNPVDAFGGPDAAMENFNDIQKAITYAMTSFFTTGGIRGGGGRKLDRFYPRSFNMGISREVFEITGGFSSLRYGEDIDLSYRIVKSGFTTALIPDAFVYHKRRTTEKAFFKQVFFSGMARINLSLRHRHTLKLVHTLPALFTVFSFLCVITLFIFPLVLLAVIWGLDSLRTYRNLNVAVMSIEMSFIQLYGYGLGFLYAFYKRILRKEPEDLSYKTKFF